MLSPPEQAPSTRPHRPAPSHIARGHARHRSSPPLPPPAAALLALPSPPSHVRPLTVPPSARPDTNVPSWLLRVYRTSINAPRVYVVVTCGCRADVASIAGHGPGHDTTWPGLPPIRQPSMVDMDGGTVSHVCATAGVRRLTTAAAAAATVATAAAAERAGTSRRRRRSGDGNGPGRRDGDRRDGHVGEGGGAPVAAAAMAMVAAAGAHRVGKRQRLPRAGAARSTMV